jgi:hypothetical protein
MRSHEHLRPIIEELDYLLAERRQLAAEGPHFIVTHGFHNPGTLCLHGETVERACLMYRWQEFPLHVSPTGLLIVDLLCRYRRTLLTAARVEQIMLTDPFYTRHGANGHGVCGNVALPHRTSIRVHIRRIREQMAKTFIEARLNLDPVKVLIAETTDSNIVVYRLKASVEFMHRSH